MERRAEVYVYNQKQLMVQISGQPPLEAAPALYSNFVGISRVGGEVQFEFIFLDLNQIANMVKIEESSKPQAEMNVVGKTVVKIIMPAENFVQLQSHLEKMFSDIKEMLQASETNKKEEPNARTVNS